MLPSRLRLCGQECFYSLEFQSCESGGSLAVNILTVAVPKTYRDRDQIFKFWPILGVCASVRVWRDVRLQKDGRTFTQKWQVLLGQICPFKDPRMKKK